MLAGVILPIQLLVPGLAVLLPHEKSTEAIVEIDDPVRCLGFRLAQIPSVVVSLGRLLADADAPCVKIHVVLGQPETLADPDAEMEPGHEGDMETVPFREQGDDLLPLSHRKRRPGTCRLFRLRYPHIFRRRTGDEAERDDGIAQRLRQDSDDPSHHGQAVSFVPQRVGERLAVERRQGRKPVDAKLRYDVAVEYPPVSFERLVAEVLLRVRAEPIFHVVRDGHVGRGEGLAARVVAPVSLASGLERFRLGAEASLRILLPLAAYPGSLELPRSCLATFVRVDSRHMRNLLLMI